MFKLIKSNKKNKQNKAFYFFSNEIGRLKHKNASMTILGTHRAIFEVRNWNKNKIRFL